VRWFVKPYASVGWSAWKAASRSIRYIFTRIEEAAGGHTLSQVSEFFTLMEEAFDGIAQRSMRVQRLLKGDATAFVLVAGADEQVLDDTEYLSEQMEKLGVPLKAVIMNRLHAEPAGSDSPRCSTYLRWVERYLKQRGVAAEVRQWVLSTYREACRVARAEAVRRDAFELGLREGVVTAAVPDLGCDVHDLPALASIVASIG
jgi:anion-transporting  ArsA/GET3 family ATPase